MHSSTVQISPCEGRISALGNATTGLVYSSVWDKMTNIIHDSDNAIGIRASNLNGDQWISSGDKQYFAAPNRINRLKRLVQRFFYCAADTV